MFEQISSHYLPCKGSIKGAILEAHQGDQVMHVKVKLIMADQLLDAQDECLLNEKPTELSAMVHG